MKYMQLDIQGKKIGFNFGLGFLGQFIEKSGIAFTELDTELEKNPFKVIPSLMYHSASYNSKRKGEDEPFTEYELIDIIDTLGGFDSNEVSQFLNAFTESMTKDVPKSEGDKISKKK